MGLQLLTGTFRAVLRNYDAVGLYVVLSAGISSVKRSVDILIKSGTIPLADEVLMQTYRFASDLFIAAGIAAASAIAFARMGCEIDRPMWKVKNDLAALNRFFVLWFIIGLLMLTFLRLLERFAGPDPVGGVADALRMAFFLWWLVAVPFGACVMFSGRLQWSNLADDLKPLAGQFRLTLLILFVNFLSFVGYLLVIDFLATRPELQSKIWLSALIDVPFCLVDCFVFAGTWLICMEHRRRIEEERDHIDFDF